MQKITELVFIVIFLTVITFIYSEIYSSIYRKGFNAGIEWERNIILEYTTDQVQCDSECESV